MRLARFGKSILAASLLATWQCHAEVLRKLPYPFAHVVTVSNDADAQPAWYGHAIHRYLNEKLGLPLGDSFWPYATVVASSSSALFSGVERRNLAPSLVDGHPVFWQLIRDFHRGYYDHFHSWHNDAVYQYRQKVETKDAEIPLAVFPYFDEMHQAGDTQPASLRLLFDAAQTSQLTVALIDAKKAERAVPSLALRSGPTLQPAPKNLYVVEVLLSAEGSPHTMQYRGQPRAIRLRNVAPGSHLVRVEWDSFSRSVVLAQLPELERFNIRPVLSSAHGGVTRAQNLGVPEMYELKPFGTPDFVQHVQWTATAAGDDRSSPAYHADLLRRLGLTSIAVIPPVDYPYTVNTRPALAPLPSSAFWESNKTWGLGIWAPAKRDELEKKLRSLDPVAALARVTDLLCTENSLCLRSEQGRTFGYTLATSLAHVAADRESVLHNWYQHLGTALNAPGPAPSAEKPFHPDVAKQAWRLSNHVYNWTGTVPAAQRVWVPSPGVWETYRIAMRNLKAAATVDGSNVRIRSVQDPVLQRRWPDERDPSRELHGLTVYVSDPARAKVQLDGKDLMAFTQNAPDETGRFSITLVNAVHPVSVLGEVTPGHLGELETSQASVTHTPKGGVALTATGTEPLLRFTPFDLALWNVGHLRWVTKRSGKGRMFLRFRTRDGRSVEWNEDSAANTKVDARAQLVRAPEGRWTDRTVALTDLRPSAPVPEGALPALPLGALHSIEIGLRDAAPRDTLAIRSLDGLQALPHAMAPDGTVVVAGRIRRADGSAPGKTTVTLKTSAGAVRTVESDEAGYYAFFSEPRGSVVRVAAALGPKAGCGARRGVWFSLRRNETEIDIDGSSCR